MITHSEGRSAEVLNDISHVSKVGLKFWIYIHFRKGVMITIIKVLIEWRKKCESRDKISSGTATMIPFCILNECNI